MFRNIFRNPLVKPNNLLLGRWKTNDNINRKIDLANIDNCGDRVCGDLIEQMKPVTDLFDKRWNNDISKDEFKDTLQKIQKTDKYKSIQKMQKTDKYKGIQKFYNNHNYSINSIVANYNERWNKNVTVEEYLKSFTRKHRGAC